MEDVLFPFYQLVLSHLQQLSVKERREGEMRGGHALKALLLARRQANKAIRVILARYIRKEAAERKGKKAAGFDATSFRTSSILDEVERKQKHEENWRGVLDERQEGAESAASTLLNLFAPFPASVSDCVIKAKEEFLAGQDVQRQRKEDEKLTQQLSAMMETGEEGKVTETDYHAYNLLSSRLLLLRQVERLALFHALLMAEVEDVVDDTEYSDENFAYGSTSVSSFSLLFSLLCRREAREKQRQKSGDNDEPSPVEVVPVTDMLRGKKVKVYGSSLGWICYYCSFFGASEVEGWELLPLLASLSKAAMKADEREGVRHDDMHLPHSSSIASPATTNVEKVEAKVEIKCADLLADDTVGDADVIILTGQCWDEQLKSKVRSKLGNDMKEGAYVVDYVNLPASSKPSSGGKDVDAVEREKREWVVTSDTEKEKWERVIRGGQDGSAGRGWGSRLLLAGCVVGSASWNPEQGLALLKVGATL